MPRVTASTWEAVRTVQDRRERMPPAEASTSATPRVLPDPQEFLKQTFADEAAGARGHDELLVLFLAHVAGLAFYTEVCAGCRPGAAGEWLAGARGEPSRCLQSCWCHAGHPNTRISGQRICERRVSRRSSHHPSAGPEFRPLFGHCYPGRHSPTATTKRKQMTALA